MERYINMNDPMNNPNLPPETPRVEHPSPRPKMPQPSDVSGSIGRALLDHERVYGTEDRYVMVHSYQQLHHVRPGDVIIIFQAAECDEHGELLKPLREIPERLVFHPHGRGSDLSLLLEQQRAKCVAWALNAADNDDAAKVLTGVGLMTHDTSASDAHRMPIPDRPMPYDHHSTPPIIKTFT